MEMESYSQTYLGKMERGWRKRWDGIDTPEQLSDAVTDLLKRIHQDIETYKGLLDRLGRMGCVSEEENLGMLQAIQDKLYSNENNNNS